MISRLIHSIAFLLAISGLPLLPHTTIDLLLISPDSHISFMTRKITHSFSVAQLDEPLYAHYLRLNPHLHRPYKDLVCHNSNDVVILSELIFFIMDLSLSLPLCVCAADESAKSRRKRRCSGSHHGTYYIARTLRQGATVYESHMHILMITSVSMILKNMRSFIPIHPHI